MNAADIRAACKASQPLRDMIDAGDDAGAAAALTEALGTPVPVTVAALAQAAPTTLAAIAGGTNPMSELEAVAARIREGNAEAVARWADVLVMLGKMTNEEYTAVQALTAAAMPIGRVSADDVSAAFFDIRPQPEGNPLGRLAVPLDWNEVN